MEKTSIEKMMEALNGVVQYNGLYQYIEQWRRVLFTSINENSGLLQRPPMDSDLPIFVQAQLEFIWMILVQIYGNYGTSPRSGWIENKEGALNFIDMILAE